MKKFFAILFVLAFAVPSYAAIAVVDDGDTKLSLYSSVRLLGVYQNVNKSGNTPQAGTNNDLVYLMQGNSRLGLDFSVGSFFSKAELKFSPDNTPAGVFRQLFVGYKFDNGLKVLVGRTNSSTETYLAYDNVYDTDNGMRGFGTIGVGRQNMVRLSMFNADLSFIALQNYNGFTLGGKGSGTISGNTTPVDVKLAIADQIMPAIELAYNLNFGPLTGKVFGFYAGVNIEGQVDGLATAQREWIQSAATGFVLKYKVAGVSTVLSAFYALNGDFVGGVKWGTTNLVKNSLKFDKPKADGSNTGDIWKGYNDKHTWGAALSVGYQILESLNATVGGGFESTSTKDNDAYAATGLLNSYSAYVALKYNINKYFMLVPTVGYYVNYGTNEKNPITNAALIAGAQLRVGF